MKCFSLKILEMEQRCEKELHQVLRKFFLLPNYSFFQSTEYDEEGNERGKEIFSQIILLTQTNFTTFDPRRFNLERMKMTKTNKEVGGFTHS